MNYRNTPFYKKLDSYLACAYAEGFCEGDKATREQVLTAWQYISDTGLWKSLQGSYGRTVRDLLEYQLIDAPENSLTPA